MLEEFKERIENAKNKQFMMLQRFHIGDTVYPFWLKNFIVYGTVIDIDTVARKIICDFNGVMRQFCPQDLMLVNPNFIANKSKNASVKKSSKVQTHLSPDTDNGINAICKECGGDIAVSYNYQTAKTDFVCTQCGKRIPENKLSEKTKKAMRKRIVAGQNNQYNDKIESVINDLSIILQKMSNYLVKIDQLAKIDVNNEQEKFFEAYDKFIMLVQGDKEVFKNCEYYDEFLKQISDLSHPSALDNLDQQISQIKSKTERFIKSLTAAIGELQKIQNYLGVM